MKTNSNKILGLSQQNKFTLVSNILLQNCTSCRTNLFYHCEAKCQNSYAIVCF